MSVSSRIPSRDQNFAAAQQKGEFVSRGSHKCWGKNPKTTTQKILLCTDPENAQCTLSPKQGLNNFALLVLHYFTKLRNICVIIILCMLSACHLVHLMLKYFIFSFGKIFIGLVLCGK